MIKNLLDDDDNSQAEEPAAKHDTGPTMLHLFDDRGETSADSESNDESFVLSQANPETYEETARKSGLAWSAGIAFFGAVLFMLIVGWGFDLLFGSSPWGLVGGIIFGSIIGFVQFFRISSQIFKKSP
jgi:F0F1-type ATP synthase assembly protein I